MPRQTSYECWIKNLSEGEFVRTKGWESSYVRTCYGNISRASIIGTIVEKKDNIITIDDGTGKIDLRVFEDENSMMESREIGQIVMVIGRPREFNNTIYMVPEIIKEIGNKKWIEYRKKKINSKKKVAFEKKNMKVEKMTVPEGKIDFHRKIIEIIKKLDDGKGAPVNKIVEMIESEEAELYLEDLLKEGELYEIFPGRLKILS
jgi:RPA family protein